MRNCFKLQNAFTIRKLVKWARNLIYPDEVDPFTLTSRFAHLLDVHTYCNTWTVRGRGIFPFIPLRITTHFMANMLHDKSFIGKLGGKGKP